MSRSQMFTQKTPKSQLTPLTTVLIALTPTLFLFPLAASVHPSNNVKQLKIWPLSAPPVRTSLVPPPPPPQGDSGVNTLMTHEAHSSYYHAVTHSKGFSRVWVVMSRRVLHLRSCVPVSPWCSPCLHNIRGLSHGGQRSPTSVLILGRKTSASRQACESKERRRSPFQMVTLGLSPVVYTPLGWISSSWNTIWFVSCEF